jgi:hypothetical protein
MSEFKQSTDPEIWHRGGGGQFRIAEMDDYYLLNVIDFLRRRANTYASRHNVDAGALLQRIPQYPTMMRELAKRGLAMTRSPAAASCYDRFSNLIVEERMGEG